MWCWGTGLVLRAPIQACWASQGLREVGDSTAGRSFFLCWSPRARATSLLATAVFVCGLAFARRRSSKSKAPRDEDLNSRLWLPLFPVTQKPRGHLSQPPRPSCAHSMARCPGGLRLILPPRPLPCLGHLGGKSSQDGTPGALGLTGYLLSPSLGQRLHGPREYQMASAGLFWARLASHFAATENWPLTFPIMLSGRTRGKRRCSHLFGTFSVPLTAPGRSARLFYSPLQSTLDNLLILQRKEPAHRH